MVRGPSPLAKPTRRDREVNWGDRTRITGSERKTLAWVSVEESRAMVVYARGVVHGGSAAAGVAFLVNVEWGHGGASVDQDFPVIHRLRVPIAASMVKISGRLVDASGKPPPATVSGEISVVIAPGLDGETLRNTEWVASAGSEGTLSSVPARLMRVEGYSGGPPDMWVMLCDGPAANGDVPIISRPVRAGQVFVVTRFDSQAFRSSIRWYASSTPLLLTKNPAAVLRIDAELLL